MPKLKVRRDQHNALNQRIKRKVPPLRKKPSVASLLDHRPQMVSDTLGPGEDGDL